MEGSDVLFRSDEVKMKMVKEQSCRGVYGVIPRKETGWLLKSPSKECTTLLCPG